MFGDLGKDNPVAAWINDNGFYIGCHPSMDQDDLEYIVEVFEEFFRSYK